MEQIKLVHLQAFYFFFFPHKTDAKWGFIFNLDSERRKAILSFQIISREN